MAYIKINQEVNDMKKMERKTIKHISFAAGGALFGLIYYKAVGCPSGSCPITSSLGGLMLYTGLIGLWLSWISSGGCCCGGGSCGIDPKDKE